MSQKEHVQEHRVALVTGAGQGIGRCTTLHLEETGWRVLAMDIDGQALGELPGLVTNEDSLLTVRADVAESDEVQRTISRGMQQFGRLDAIVNNTGVGVNKPIEELSPADWHRVINTNLTSIYHTTHFGIEALRQQGGNIINIASTRALMSEANTEAYSASKGGVVAMTHALAVSLGPTVRVNCISPGWIETRDWKKQANRREPSHSEDDRMQHPAGRVGKPADIAAMVAYLLSDEASFITGQNFVIDGGMTRKMIYV